MQNLSGNRGMRPRGFNPLAPVAAVIAVVGVVAVSVIALLALMVTMLFLPRARRKMKVFRFGGADRPKEPAAPANAPQPERSHAEVVEAWPLVAGGTLALLLLAGSAHAKLLVPMDDSQTNHLKAYGLTYWALTKGVQAEWLLNYRGGSFLLPDDAATEREANIRGVSTEAVSGSAEANIRATIADENMEVVKLEKAPRVAVYIPPNAPPWDDAVTMSLKYADIPYEKVWDEEVLRGSLKDYDWLHLHHEDFTGQHGKFWAAYHTFPWYQEEERVQQAMATKLGFAKVSQL